MTRGRDARAASRSAGVAAVLAAVWVAGCSTPSGPPDGAVADAARAAPALRLRDVPFVAQPREQCGPAALAIAMAAAGRSVPVEALADTAFLPGRRGTLQADMLAAVRRHGLLATELPRAPGALRAELAAGRPVVVLLNLGLSAFPIWHYAVVVGDDPARGEVLLHSDERPNLAMSAFTFERTFERAGRWAIAITDPRTLPASADETSALRAVAGLERADTAAARAGWDALVERWPASRLARFGRANRLLEDGDARGAADGYRAALAIDAGFADAWNNLAQALAAAGDRRAAREAAERAVALGGPRVDAYRDTLATLAR
ncbi:MAG TPA: PA2778 family cysteine peptidase [Burkholderiaceae bacterium]|nr:PA2778 family cysteine peptidase [Burkholderiaceae bacterium]